MKLLEILTTLLLPLTLVNSSNFSELNPDEVAVPNAQVQTDYSPLPAYEVRTMLVGAVLRNDPIRVRTVLENHVLPSQSPDRDILQQAVSHPSVGKNIPSKDELDINDAISDKGPLLHWAANNGHSDLISMLIVRGADIDSKFGKFAMTPFMHAATNGHDTVVAQFLNALATQPERMHSLITEKDNRGWTALHLAILGGHKAVVGQFLNALTTQPEFIHSLITTKDNDGMNALHLAAQGGHDAVVAQLLNALATKSEHICSLITIQNKYGMNALHLAAQGGHDAVVAQLLNALATKSEHICSLITIQNKYGMNALHLAARGGYDAVVALLLNALAADPERMHSLITAQDNDGTTALHLAAQGGYDAVVAQLLNALAAQPERMHSLITAQNSRGSTALHYAARDGRDAVVAQLLNALATQPELVHSLITAKDNGDCTALHYACRESKTETVKVLLERYKEALDRIALNTSSSAARLPSTCTDFASLVDPQGMALALSVTHDCAEIIDLLVQLGANLDVRDENGDTHLHRAARDGRSAVVTALVANRAESQRNNAGNTPHDVAQGLTPEAMNLLEECAANYVLK